LPAPVAFEKFPELGQLAQLSRGRVKAASQFPNAPFQLGPDARPNDERARIV